MTTRRDPDRMIRAFLAEGSERLADPVYDAVRAEIDSKRQRVVVGPWRMPAVNRIVPIGLGAAAVIAVLVVGLQVLRPSDASTVGGAATPAVSPLSSVSPSPSDSLAPATAPPPSAAGAAGGTVTFELDGAPVTTAIDVADGSTISGTAVTTWSGRGIHTVQLECAARVGDTWAVAGTTEATTLEGERAGDWSAVVVKDGSPQQVGIWVSDPKTAGVDCGGWLGSADIGSITADNFHPVASGTLVPPAVPNTAGAPGGTVTFQMDGRPATTQVDIASGGAGVSGTAVTTWSGRGVHTVRLQCAVRDGDTWALGGTVQTTTVPGEKPGPWSAVVVREGSPQQVAIWLSVGEATGSDCAAWLGGMSLRTITPENFSPVESGLLLPPPDASS